jgi:hypothetical protein
MSMNSSFYGDQMRWFIGVVEETGTDEPRLGRVKVRIHGVHGDSGNVPTEDLPYAQVLIPTTEGGVSGVGMNANIMVSAQVFGIFLDGKNSQLPLVLGSIPKIEMPSREQIEEIYTNPTEGTLIQPTKEGIVDAYAPVSEPRPDINNKYPNSNNLNVAWEYLSVHGFKPVPCAAILGNFWVESYANKTGDLRPDANDNRIAFGLAQWEGPRLHGPKGLDAFARKNPHFGDRASVVMQLEFMMSELKTSERGSVGVKKMTDVTDAAVYWQHRYERNAHSQGKPDSRIKGAPRVRSKYKVNGKPINHRIHEKDRIEQAIRIYKLFTEAEA